MEALSDKSKRTCEGCWFETFRPSVDDTRPARQCDSVRPKALRKTTWDISSDISQANSGMASGSPNHHLDRLVYCVGDRPGTPPLASNRELIGVNSRWLRTRSTSCRSPLTIDRPDPGDDLPEIVISLNNFSEVRHWPNHRLGSLTSVAQLAESIAGALSEQNSEYLELPANRSDRPGEMQ